MNTLISDLNDLSKIEAGRLRLEFKAVSVDDVIDEVVTLFDDENQKYFPFKVEDKEAFKTQLQDNFANIYTTNEVSHTEVVANIMGIAKS